MKLSGLGPHCADGYHTNSIASILQLQRSLQPAYINILRAGNPQQAFDLANGIANQTETQVFIRHRFGGLAKGDEKVLEVYPDPRDYYNDVVTQYIGTKLILVVGNEITLSSYNTPFGGQSHIPAEKRHSYVSYMVQLMRWMHDAKVRGAFFRFPAWHPYREQFKQFDIEVRTVDLNGQNPIVVKGVRDAFQRWPEHVFSPNWYVAPGNIDAIDKGIAFRTHIGNPLFTVVGEFGWIANPTAARSGFRTAMSQREAANWHIDIWSAFLKPHGIAACYFNKLVWTETDTFQTDQDFEATLLEHKERLLMDIPPLPVTPPQSLPEMEAPYAAILTIETKLRHVPSTTAPQAPYTVIPSGTKVEVRVPKEPQNADTYTWYYVKVLSSGAVGWMALHDPELFSKIDEPPMPPPPSEEIVVKREWLESIQGSLRQMVEHYAAMGNHLQILTLATEGIEQDVSKIIGETPYA